MLLLLDEIGSLYTIVIDVGLGGSLRGWYEWWAAQVQCLLGALSPTCLRHPRSWVILIVAWFEAKFVWHFTGEKIRCHDFSTLLRLRLSLFVVIFLLIFRPQITCTVYIFGSVLRLQLLLLLGTWLRLFTSRRCELHWVWLGSTVRGGVLILRTKFLLDAALSRRDHRFIDDLLILVVIATRQFVRTRGFLNHRALQFFASKADSGCRETWYHHRVVILSWIFEKTFRFCPESWCLDQFFPLLFRTFLMRLLQFWFIWQISILRHICRPIRGRIRNILRRSILIFLDRDIVAKLWSTCGDIVSGILSVSRYG